MTLRNNFRGYTNHSHDNSKRVLVTWSQRLCIRCKRFLSKRQIKYCSRCWDNVDREQKNKAQKVYQKKLKDLIV